MQVFGHAQSPGPAAHKTPRGSSPFTQPHKTMLTARGTPYRLLLALAGEGAPPSRLDCEHCERHARTMAQRKDAPQAVRDIARTELLIARALWSAWRANHPRSED